MAEPDFTCQGTSLDETKAVLSQCESLLPTILMKKLGHFPVFTFTSLVPAILHTLKKNFPVKATRL